MARNPNKPPTVELKGPAGLVRVTVLSVRTLLAQTAIDEDGGQTPRYVPVDPNELQEALLWLERQGKGSAEAPVTPTPIEVEETEEETELELEEEEEE